MSADTAPAAMPGEIERLIAEAAMVCHQAGYHDLGQGLDEVVAPILAEKEALEQAILRGNEMLIAQVDRALAAEAALAAERERCAGIAEQRAKELRAIRDKCGSHSERGQNADHKADTADNIAAAIRAQGE
ncbi:hypothetical protein [Bosea sp. UC22_33]|uniref:hypothetical protein n=1 Tax=Bosea sp. UC22_33 TaxID=3350165 RepID=UPI00366DC82E